MFNSVIACLTARRDDWRHQRPIMSFLKLCTYRLGNNMLGYHARISYPSIIIAKSVCTHSGGEFSSGLQRMRVA